MYTNEELDEAYKQVKKEFDELCEYSDQVTPSMMMKVRDHARGKFRINVEFEKLSPYERAWYGFFKIAGDQLKARNPSLVKVLDEYDALVDERETANTFFKILKRRNEEIGNTDKGRQIIIASFVVGLFFGYLLFSSFLMSIIFCISTGIIGFLLTSLVVKSPWAESILAIYINIVGEKLNSKWLKDLALYFYSEALGILKKKTESTE